MYKYGIDVSQHQGLINWEKVKEQIDFAILRICWIGNKRNHTMDAMFDYNYNECKRLGIPIGGYVYSYAESKDAVIDGADFVLNNTQDKEFELPIFLDLEDEQISGIEVEEQTYNAIEFCNFIEQYSDCKGGVYANLNWFNNHLNKEELFDNGIDCWIAHWDRAPESYAESKYMMLQYADNGEIDGIDGNVDLNCLYEFNINPTDDPIESNDDLDVKYRYQNGSTRESVFADTDCTKEIGSLDPYENVACLGTVNSKAIVLYTVNGDNNKKIGFVKWIGGVKNE